MKPRTDWQKVALCLGILVIIGDIIHVVQHRWVQTYGLGNAILMGLSMPGLLFGVPACAVWYWLAGPTDPPDKPPEAHREMNDFKIVGWSALALGTCAFFSSFAGRSPTAGAIGIVGLLVAVLGLVLMAPRKRRTETHPLLAGAAQVNEPHEAAVAKPGAEAPMICARTNSQPSDELPRQIPAPMGPRPKWRMRRLAIGTAAALAIIAVGVAVRFWRDAAQPNKLQAFDAVPTWDETEEVQGGAHPNEAHTVDPLEDVRARAEKGDAGAQANLGGCYYSGQGVPQDYTEAAKWFQKAAEQNNADAQNSLGLCCANGQGVPKDPAEAAKWYRRAADQGNAYAQYNLSGCYASGQGVSQDLGEGAKWIRKAAEQRDADAQEMLGFFYANGIGVQQDHTEAAKWYRRGANQGDGLSQFMLGDAYANGEGIPPNDIEAFKWYCLGAAHQGCEFSAEARDRIAQRMARAEIVEGQRRAAAFVASKEGGGGGEGGISPTPEIAEGRGCAGTGFFVTDDGYFVTCEHVVRGATSFHVRSPSGLLAARLIKKDRTIDVAVLKVDGAFRALPVAARPRVKLGDAVFTVGFPNPVVQGVEPKLTRGEISSMAGIQDNPRYYQISVPVQPGNSGGALLDECGNAVGVVTSRLDDVATYQESGALPQNVNYALKGGFVYSFLSGVPELSGRLKAPRTGRDREAASGAAERAAVLVVAE